MKNSQELVGKRVELICMYDDQAPEPGTKGVITKVDDMGTIHVDWENGSTLGLILNEDKYKIL
jgi:hypothetical protein